MNGIRTNAAAVMLGISPNTLRSWERRYGFPQAASLGRWPSAVLADRDRGAAADACRDPQRLLGHLAGPRARRGAVHAAAPGGCLRRVRRGCRQSPAGGEPGSALGGAHDRGGAPGRRGRAVRARRHHRGVRVRLALRRRLAVGAASPGASRRPPRRRDDLRRLGPRRPRRHVRPGARGGAAAAEACARCRSPRRSSCPGWAGRSARWSHARSC